MAPPKKPWFRAYVEMLHDPKLRRLKPEQRWVWIACLAAARMSHRPGYLYVAEDIPMEAQDLAELAGVQIKVAVDAVERFMAMRMLGVENGGEDDQVWFIPKWGDRQFESDDSTPRSRKSRDATTMQRPINGDATHQRQTTETESETEAENRESGTDDDDDLQSVGPSSVVVEVAPLMAAHLWRIAGVHESKRNRWIETTTANIIRERAAEIDGEAIRRPDLDAAELADGIVNGRWPPRLRAVPDELPYHGPFKPPGPAVSQDEHIERVRARAAAGDEQAKEEMQVWEKRLARKALGGSR